MAEEYVLAFRNAMQEWQTASDRQNLGAYNNAVSFMLIAIKKAGQVVPRFHSLLAMMYYEMAACQAQAGGRNADKLANQSLASAQQQATIALQNNPLEFRAQLVKTWIAGDNVLFMKGGASNLLPTSRGFAEALGETFGRAIGTSIAAAQSQTSKSNFKKELTKLLDIFNTWFGDYYVDATEFVFAATNLMNLADVCSEDKLFEAGKIYAGIANVNLDDLKYDDVSPDDQEDLQQEIYRIRVLAEGRSLM